VHYYRHYYCLSLYAISVITVSFTGSCLRTFYSNPIPIQFEISGVRNLILAEEHNDGMSVRNC